MERQAFIYFQTVEGVGQQIYRSSAGGGEATLMAASGTIDVPVESPDGRSLYFARPYSDTQLMMLPLDRRGATAEPVPGMPKLASDREWYVGRHGIYFNPEHAPRSICFYDSATGRVREILKTDKDIDSGISVSPDGQYMLYSQNDEYTSRIMLVGDFH